jgi:hypothetical protein
MLCTGLAVLGLCFPIPGVTSRSQLEQAKWGPFIAEGESDWWVNRSFSSGSVGFVVSLGGRQKELLTVFLQSPGMSSSELETSLPVRCSPAGSANSQCTIGENSFRLRRCGGGVVMTALKLPLDLSFEEFVCGGGMPVPTPLGPKWQIPAARSNADGGSNSQRLPWPTR